MSLVEKELERRRTEQKNSGYIAVDFDGTLAVYDGWCGWNQFGSPIPAMVERIRSWLAEGYTVKIFTARLAADQDPKHLNRCMVTGYRYSRQEMQDAIGEYCEEHIGEWLEAINVKCLNMIELWDDRVIQVIPNTGRTLAEEHAAELSALKGAP
jgi:hypothetical protein